MSDEALFLCAERPAEGARLVREAAEEARAWPDTPDLRFSNPHLILDCMIEGVRGVSGGSVEPSCALSAKDGVETDSGVVCVVVFNADSS